DRDSSRLVIETKVTNPGENAAPVAPGLQFEFEPADPKQSGAGPRWFLPAAGIVELFTPEPGKAEMADGNYGEGAPVGPRFGWFTPGESAPLPRYEAGGWAAVETSAGRVFIYYDRNGAEAEPAIPLLGASFFDKATLPPFAFMEYKFTEHG